jgi:hypothetical protein
MGKFFLAAGIASTTLGLSGIVGTMWNEMIFQQPTQMREVHYDRQRVYTGEPITDHAREVIGSLVVQGDFIRTENRTSLTDYLLGVRVFQQEPYGVEEFRFYGGQEEYVSGDSIRWVETTDGQELQNNSLRATCARTTAPWNEIPASVALLFLSAYLIVRPQKPNHYQRGVQE